MRHAPPQSQSHVSSTLSCLASPHPSLPLSLSASPSLPLALSTSPSLLPNPLRPLPLPLTAASPATPRPEASATACALLARPWRPDGADALGPLGGTKASPAGNHRLASSLPRL
eukprot:360029-Chlamydomonas_euryale.AAC.1